MLNTATKAKCVVTLLLHLHYEDYTFLPTFAMVEITVGDSSTADIPSDLINPEHMTFHNAPHPVNREPNPIQITT